MCETEDQEESSLGSTGNFASGNVPDAKCADCICGIPSPEGIWCARLKRWPTEKDVAACEDFVPREFIE